MQAFQDSEVVILQCELELFESFEYLGQILKKKILNYSNQMIKYSIIKWAHVSNT
jgi:hypothetical protein